MLDNMTDEKEAKEWENLLRCQERIILLGHFVVGIAHQIIDPLTGINIYLGILEKSYNKRGEKEDLEMVSEIISKLQSASQRIENIVKGIIDFSRVREPKFVLTGINRPVEAAIMISSASLQKEGIKLRKKLAVDLPLCHADTRLIKQLVLNLINNARKGMENMGKDKKIEVGTSLGNNSIVVTVSDSRPLSGLDLRKRIFDNSYENRDGNPEIDLGFSMIERIIGEHKGFLGVLDSKWGGAEFRIEIPVEKGTNKA